MRFEELSADEFAQSMALIGEAVSNLAQGDLGASFKADVAAFRADGSEADAGDWAVGMLLKYLPAALEGYVDDGYRILAALDGQTLDEYKACFTPAKLVSDVKAAKDAFGAGGSLRGLLGSFFG